MEFAEFILAHEGDDLGRLALDRKRYVGQVDDFDLALTTLEVRRKLRTKVPEWFAVPSLRYPVRVSGEQCSSAETARYKAAVALAACSGDAGSAKTAENALPASPEELALRRNGTKCVTSVASYRLADLTGGLGVDSWAFSQVFDRVLYNEMRPELAQAARHNFLELGIDNILVKSCTLGAGTKKGFGTETESGSETGEGMGMSALSVAGVLGDFQPDILFLDPARRASDGRKVFRIEDCQPDVLQLLPELLDACPKLLLKLSPMADISLVCKQLACVKEVHVVAAEGECKELLLLLERGWIGPWSVTVCEGGAVAEPGIGGAFAPSCTDLFGLGLKKKATPGPLNLAQRPIEGNNNGRGPEPKMRPGPKQGETWPKEDGEQLPLWLFEPGKALLKSGAFDWPCRFGLSKLGRHTHLYVSDAPVADLAPFGKWYRILEVVPLNNKSIKDISARYSGADVTARNIPLGSEQLRAKLAGKPQPGAIAAGTVHIFGIHVDALDDNLLLVTARVV